MKLHPGFVAGLVAGEGSFTIHERNGGQSLCCAFALAQRADDVELLKSARDSVGCGKLYPVAATGTSKPQVTWTVASMADCRQLAAYLDNAPLLAKKAHDFSVWRRGSISGAPEPAIG